MAEEADRIDPWSSRQYEDYDRLLTDFGISRFDLGEYGLKDPSILFRRGVIFGHRDFGSISSAYHEGRRWAVLTGLAPSGKMHFGHKTVVDQVRYFQTLGADIFVAVADLEAWGARGVSLEEGRKMAIEEYILNYIAMGLRPENCQVYFQSLRGEVKDLGYQLSRKVNWSTMKAIYGFDDSTNMSHVQSPLVQVGDILHVQLEKHGGPCPTIVPVGVDQDPHIRLTRDIGSAFRMYSVLGTEKDGIGVFLKGADEDVVEELLSKAKYVLGGIGFSHFKLNVPYKALYVQDATVDDAPRIDIALEPLEVKLGGFGFHPPSSTYNKFMTSLTGEKMSSSKPDSAVFLTDTPEQAKKKLMSAKTGGGVTVEDHKRDGGNPDVCVVYEMLQFHLVEDDAHLEEIYSGCKAGERLCGHCKKEAVELISVFLTDLAEKREEARDRLDEYVRYD